MTGPEHYAEAERLLREVREEADQCGTAGHQCALDAAQVHATLALVAATTDMRVTTPQQPWGGTETYSASDWAGVIQ